ncbi:MAG: carbon-nitrogen hydrolase family protein [Candidatus Thermoplasmatota archaeon]
MRFALVSMRPRIGDKEGNIEIMSRAISGTRADMYVFGELSLTGYKCKDEWLPLAESVDGPSIKRLKGIAKRRDCYIVFGMPLLDENVKGLVHNASVLIHPDGKVDHYEKWFLPTVGPFEEKIFFDQGERLPVFQTRFGKVGLLVCYDLFFPEASKALSLQGADIIVYISATPSITRGYFETLLPARALENTVYVVFVNLVGAQDDLVFWGGSRVYDPLGVLLVKAPYFKSSTVVCDIDVSKERVARMNRPLIRDVRPEIYLDLYELSRYHIKSGNRAEKQL